MLLSAAAMDKLHLSCTLQTPMLGMSTAMVVPSNHECLSVTDARQHVVQAAIARLKAETASKGASMGRTQSLPSQANPGLERTTSSNTGLSGFSCSTLLHVRLS